MECAVRLKTPSLDHTPGRKLLLSCINNDFAIVDGLNWQRFSLRALAAAENLRSGSAEVAGIDRMIRADFERDGYSLAFEVHHVRT